MRSRRGGDGSSVGWGTAVVILISKGGTAQKEGSTGHEAQEGVLPTEGCKSKDRCRDFLGVNDLEREGERRKREGKMELSAFLLRLGKVEMG